MKQYRLISLYEHSKGEGIGLSYSNKTERFFINNITKEPTDCYGVNRETIQSCVILTPTELDAYIKLLMKLRKKMKPW